MFGTYFYHEKIRKSVSLFGRMFNNIYVMRKNSTGGVINQLKVPLAYAPRMKYLERLRQNPDLYTDEKVAIKLPRMSFEITSFIYDNTRQLTKVTNFKTVGTEPGKRQKFNTPVPYTLTFDLNIYAKNQDDALQIVEQILPTFNPQYTLTIKPFPDEYPTFKEDIPIIIIGVNFSDDFEAEYGNRRTIIYTLSFEMKLQFYGPINQGDVIRKAVPHLFLMDTGAQGDSDKLLETITVQPDPLTAIGMPDSDFGFSTEIDLAFDSA
jgi:hypothetical protein|tara:strand:+ start:1465 stop:2259 length:795 start_codon:yes stop_codon:yes gene_type:complete